MSSRVPRVVHQKLLERTGNGRVSEVESQVRGTGGRIDSTWPRAPCRFGMTGEHSALVTKTDAERVRLCPQRADRALHELRDLDRGRLNLRMSLQILDVVLAIFLAFATSSSPVGSGCGRSAPKTTPVSGVGC